MLRYAAFFTLFLHASLQADWRVDAENSVLNFVSFKNGTLAEAHVFEELRGGVDDAGRLEVAIALDSLDTLIPIRDQRMRELLFKTDEHPLAIFRGQIEMRELLALGEGASRKLKVPGSLSLHGAEVRLTLDIRLSRLDENRFQAVAATPALLRAGDFGLLKGLEKLRELARLQDINPTVPVYFSLQLVRKN